MKMAVKEQIYNTSLIMRAMNDSEIRRGRQSNINRVIPQQSQKFGVCSDQKVKSLNYEPNSAFTTLFTCCSSPAKPPPND
mmetsp:Transcript_18318/g.30999  ORF Transcript_18318/g.30999 Transcript_18318/m.30999 type:complete len:80 (-) Transcript_18318:62-301(-)